jgi:hypothetical protein
VNWYRFNNYSVIKRDSKQKPLSAVDSIFIFQIWTLLRHWIYTSHDTGGHLFEVQWWFCVHYKTCSRANATKSDIFSSFANKCFWTGACKRLQRVVYFVQRTSFYNGLIFFSCIFSRKKCIACSWLEVIQQIIVHYAGGPGFDVVFFSQQLTSLEVFNNPTRNCIDRLKKNSK